MILSVLFGTTGFFVTHAFQARTLNVLASSGIQYVRLRSDGDGNITFAVPLYKKKALCNELDKLNIEYEMTGDRGLPELVHRYRRRWGLAAGIIIFAGVTALSSRVIWCVEISGNKEVPDSEIENELDALGCGVGDFYSGISFDSLHNDFLIRDHRIAWISVNMDGTHAHVEVRETMTGAGETDCGFYNVVAAEDGQIEQVSSYEGKPVVRVGDVVRKGELLITGVISYKETKVRYESASGEIYARVLRSFTAEVPDTLCEKVYTGREKRKNSLSFFDFHVNLFINSGIQYEFYDTIMSERKICLFESVFIPVKVSTEIAKEYTEVTKTLTETEAKILAEAKYSALLRETLGAGRLLSKTVEHSYGDDGVYRINCSFYCIDNIARKIPLSINETESEIRDGRENSNNTAE